MSSPPPTMPSKFGREPPHVVIGTGKPICDADEERCRELIKALQNKLGEKTIFMAPEDCRYFLEDMMGKHFVYWMPEGSTGELFCDVFLVLIPDKPAFLEAMKMRSRGLPVVVMQSSGGKELIKLFSGMGINGPFKDYKEYPPGLSMAAAFAGGNGHYEKVYYSWDGGHNDVGISLGILAPYY